MTDQPAGQNGPEREEESEAPPASEEVAGEATQGEAQPSESEPGRDPVRLATLVVLALCVVLFLIYLRADRIMPYSDQARVSGYTVSVTPQVSGYLTGIEVELHEVVEPGRVLVRIDTSQYQIAVRAARATLDNTIQQLGVADAGVASAAARLAAARAQESIARLERDRLLGIAERNANALARADLDRAESASTQAEAQVASAEAELQRARAQLGVQGEGNPAIRSAMAGLEQAELNLARTVLRAPARGAIESLELDVGHFAAAGQPLMTFVSTSGVWIRADMRENNLENLEPGDAVWILLDAVPGRILHGTLRSVGLGVSSGGGSSRGELPNVSPTTGWLRQPQQFPVIIDLGDDVPGEELRVGAQANVMVFTRERALLNPIGRLVMRTLSLLSYVR